jgi:hypothetical protein
MRSNASLSVAQTRFNHSRPELAPIPTAHAGNLPGE